MTGITGHRSGRRNMDAIALSDKTALIGEIEKNLWETWSTYGRGPECTLHDEEDALWFETPIPIIPYNGVLRFRVRERIDERIDLIVDRFRGRGVQFTWLVHPSSFPSDLPVRLERRALRNVEPIYGMARTLDDLPDIPSPPEGFEIRKVTGDSDVTAFYHFAAWRWHIPKEYRKAYNDIASGFRLGKPGSRAHMWQHGATGNPLQRQACTWAPDRPASTVLLPGLRPAGADWRGSSPSRPSTRHTAPVTVLRSCIPPRWPGASMSRLALRASRSFNCLLRRRFAFEAPGTRHRLRSR